MHFSNYVARRSLFLIAGFLLSRQPVSGQLVIGGGLEYGGAIFLNHPLFAGRPSMAACGELAYIPPNGNFYPSFCYRLKSLVVPVQNSPFKNLDDIAMEHNFALRLNYRTSREQHFSVLFVGIGVAGILPEKSLSDQYGNEISLADSATVNLYGLVQAGARYMTRVLPNSGFYLGLEAYVQYVAMKPTNYYRLQQGSTVTAATISGDVVMPSIAVKLLYAFEKAERY